MKKRRKTNIRLLILTVLIVAAAIWVYFNAENKPANAPQGATLNVLVMDVGQADSILVTMSTGETMLIDAGEDASADAIFEELDERGITQIDVLVATHPHSDHIGGMQSIVERCDVSTIYMPDMPGSSKTYQRLMKAIKNKDVPVVAAYAGERFQLGAAQCTIVSPGKDDDIDANNESVVIFLDYLDTECLFTGDMEGKAETEVLSDGYNVDADILKVAHHGSSTGTRDDFLAAVSPDYAVISCGKENPYGHPNKQTLDLLSGYGLTPYRTDLSGDILFASDGHTIQVSTGD